MTNQADSNKKQIIVISLLTAACLLGDSMLYIVLPIHWQDVGLASLWEVGILLSVNRMVRLPLNPVVGWLYGRMSSRKGIVFAGLLATCTTLSYAFVKGFMLWLLVRCVWGIAWTFLRLGAYFIILEVTGENNRGHYMGLYNGLYRLGSLVGMLTGGFLADRFGIGITATLFAGVTVFTIPFAYRLLSGSNSYVPVENKSFEVSALISSNVVWTLLTGLFLAMVYQGTFTATLSYLIQVHSSSPLLIFGVSMGAASLAGLLQALRWSWEPWLAPWFGKLSDGKLGRQTILIATLLIAAGLFALLPLQIPLELWLLLILLILLTATILTTIIDTIACDVACNYPAKAFMTAYSLAIDIGAALGPLIGYALNDSAGPYTIYWVIAAGLFILAIKGLVWPSNLYAK